jgi:magnesium-transporting ATPase (P-type)
VFARAKPNDKTRAIVVYQTMGKITAMCGDGANDCGALKQADAGLSLSEAEASISSPFTSKTPNISSMIDLIRECRGGLATNFSLFNIMALYSLIQYTSTVITEYYYGYPADLEYLYWDLGCNFFFFLTIGYTASSENLSKLRPSDSLFSVSNIICVLVMFIIQLVGQISVIIVMANQPFYDILNYGTMAGEINDLNAYFANGNTFSQTTL